MYLDEPTTGLDPISRWVLRTGCLLAVQHLGCVLAGTLRGIVSDVVAQVMNTALPTPTS